MNENYDAAVSLNWMVAIHIHRGPGKESVHVYAPPWNILSDAARMWASIPDAMAISVETPRLSLDRCAWEFRDYKRGRGSRKAA